MSTLGLALVLVLRTYDLVGLPAPEAANAERTATAILARAHIQVSWVSCRLASAGPQDRLCNEARRPSELIVRIITAPAQLANSALADAHVDMDAAFGTFATVYADRVRNLAAVGRVDPGILMGRAIAHEVGHLLSGTSAHAATGLMRAAWSAPMLRHDGEWAWMFSNREGELLRAKLGERLALASTVQLDRASASPQQIALTSR